MVELVESWEDFEEAAERSKGAYQVIEGNVATEIRVRAGRFAYMDVLENENPLLKRILNYCKVRDFIKIRGSIRDEQFFTAPMLE